MTREKLTENINVRISSSLKRELRYLAMERSLIPLHKLVEGGKEVQQQISRTISEMVREAIEDKILFLKYYYMPSRNIRIQIINRLTEMFNLSPATVAGLLADFFSADVETEELYPPLVEGDGIIIYKLYNSSWLVDKQTVIVGELVELAPPAGYTVQNLVEADIVHYRIWIKENEQRIHVEDKSGLSYDILITAVLDGYSELSEEERFEALKYTVEHGGWSPVLPSLNDDDLRALARGETIEKIKIIKH